MTIGVLLINQTKLSCSIFCSTPGKLTVVVNRKLMMVNSLRASSGLLSLTRPSSPRRSHLDSALSSISATIHVDPSACPSCALLHRLIN